VFNQSQIPIVFGDIEVQTYQTVPWDDPTGLTLSKARLGAFERIVMELLNGYFHWINQYNISQFALQDGGSPVDSHNNLAQAIDLLEASLQPFEALLTKMEVTKMEAGNSSSQVAVLSDIRHPLLNRLNDLFGLENNPSVEKVMQAMNAEIGDEFVKMFGFNRQPAGYPLAKGSLKTSAYYANLCALIKLRAARYLGFCVAKACKQLQLDIPLDMIGSAEQCLLELNDWELLNLSLDDSLKIWKYYVADDVMFPLKLKMDTLNQLRPEFSGYEKFFQKFWTIKSPVLIISAGVSNHWLNIAKQLGLSPSQIITIPVNKNMHMDISSLERIVQQAIAKETPILSVVVALGSKDFSNIDRINKVVKLRAKCLEQGLFFPIHLDARWGGSFISMFRTPEGGFLEKDLVAKGLQYFPSDTAYQCFASIHQVDSVSIAPHRTLLNASIVGALVFKNQWMWDVLTPQSLAGEENTGEKEGKQNKLMSKINMPLSPIITAVIYFGLKLLPLNNQGIGKYLLHSVYMSEYFFNQVQKLQLKMKKIANIIMPVEPDTNIVTLIVNPGKNKNIELMNQFNQQLFEQLLRKFTRSDENSWLSSTHIDRNALTHSEVSRLALELGFSPEQFSDLVKLQSPHSSQLFVLTHTFIHRELMNEATAKLMIDSYIEELERLLMEYHHGEWLQQNTQNGSI